MKEAGAFEELDGSRHVSSPLHGGAVEAAMEVIFYLAAHFSTCHQEIPCRGCKTGNVARGKKSLIAVARRLLRLSDNKTVSTIRWILL